MSKDIFKEL